MKQNNWKKIEKKYPTEDPLLLCPLKERKTEKENIEELNTNFLCRKGTKQNEYIFTIHEIFLLIHTFSPFVTMDTVQSSLLNERERIKRKRWINKQINKSFFPPYLSSISELGRQRPFHSFSDIGAGKDDKWRVSS